VRRKLCNWFGSKTELEYDDGECEENYVTGSVYNIVAKQKN